MVRKDESIEKTYFVFWFSWKPLCFKWWSFKTTFECDKKNQILLKQLIKPLFGLVIHLLRQFWKLVKIKRRKLRPLLSKLLMIKPLSLVLLNKTILLMNPCTLLINNLTILKKKLLKELFLLKNLLRKIYFCKNWETFDWFT